jgi:hypothetical protein
MMPIVLRDPGVGRTLDEYYVEAGMGVKIKIRLAEVLREIGPLENVLGIRGRENLYLSFREGLKRAASRLHVNLTEEQEGRLLYYLTREVRHSVIEPFMLDENVKGVKVVGLNVLVIHKGYDFLGWLKTNAVFTDARHIKKLVARLVGKRPTNPPAES